MTLVLMRSNPLLSFVRAFWSSPRRTGSLIPSSNALAQAMVEGLPLGRASRILELGPGTGAITETILSSIDHSDHYLGIDLNPTFIELLHGRFPEYRFVQDEAALLGKHLPLLPGAKADAILSGLPWSLFSAEAQESTVAAIADALTPEGEFRTFVYVHATSLPSYRAFSEVLRKHFSEIERSKLILRNAPPAWVVRCRGPGLTPRQ